MIRAQDITAIILAGGRGERLRSAVPDRPKVLAEVGGRPFLSFVLDHLAHQGIKKTVLCVGYLADMIIDRFGDSYNGLAISYSHEAAPAGTGGALRLAIPHLTSDPVLVQNGDSFSRIDLAAMLAFYENRPRQKECAVIAASSVTSSGRFGSLELAPSGEVIAFREKAANTGGPVNAGMYLLSRDIISLIPEGRPCSLENDLFPALCDGRLFGFVQKTPFIDIGTPESYAFAQTFLNLKGE